MTLSRILIHTEEKPYGKSVHTEEKPYIYDFVIVSLIDKPGSQKYPPFKPIVQSEPFWSQRALGFKGIANLMLKSSLFILLCEADADFRQIATFIL